MFNEKKAANEYMQKILAGNFEPETEEERGAFQRLQQVTAEMNRSQQEATTLTKQAAEMQALANKLAGKREAYLEMLITAELRRVAKKTGKPIPLDEFRDRVGAKKVEAYDSEGNLISQTEEANGADDGKPGQAGEKTAGEPQSPRVIPPRH